MTVWVRLPNQEQPAPRTSTLVLSRTAWADAFFEKSFGIALYYRYLWIKAFLNCCKWNILVWRFSGYLNFLKKLSFISAIYPFIFVYQVFIILKTVSWNVNWLAVFALWTIEINVIFFGLIIQFPILNISCFILVRKSTEII